MLHLIITLPLAYFLNIWADEASTLYTTENGVFRAFQNVLADEKQAPLYFLFLSVWREIHPSIFWARLPSIIFSLLAIKFFHDLARKFFDAKAAAFITAVFALHPFLIWASLEIRVYSLVILLSILLLKFFFEAYFQSEDAEAQRKARIFYILTAAIALYTNYYLGFLLIGNFLALVVCRKWREAKRYFLHMLIVGAAILPLLSAIAGQFAVNTNRFQPEKSVLVGLKFLWNHFLTFVLPTEIFPPEEATGISFIRVWLVRLAILATVLRLFKKRKIADENLLALTAICAAGFAFLLIAYFLLGEIYVEIRHAAFVFAPLILCVGLVWREVLGQEEEMRRRGDEEKRRRGEREKGRKGEREIITSAQSSPHLLFSSSPLLISLAGLLLIFYGYSIYALYPNLAKRGDWARVGKFIEQNEQPNQPIIVFTAFDALALPYHYGGKNKILPDEKFFAFEAEAENGSADSWRRQTEFIISEIPADAGEIWLLTNEKCAVKDACAPLENFAAANYTIISEQDFYKEKIRLLRRTQK